jgi:hypothetical protein
MTSAMVSAMAFFFSINLKDAMQETEITTPHVRMPLDTPKP